MKIRTIEPTPNPNALKFVLDRRITARPRNHPTPASANEDPLAQALFAVAGIETVFVCDDFVTVTMTPDADWRQVHEHVVAVLQEHEPGDVATAGAAAGVGAGTGTTAAPQVAGGSSNGDPEMLTRINAVLDDRVRPALAGDGGGLEVLGLDGKTLQIRYQGACGSCPSSIAGTLAAIQNLLQHEIDTDLQVVSA